jgi:hypothetical protein
MKLTIFIGFLLGLNSCVAWGQQSQSHTVRATATPFRAQPSPESASISFLTAPGGPVVQSLGPGQAVLDLGVCSYFPQTNLNEADIQRQKDTFILSTKFGLRIGLSNGRHGGTAAVSAFLLTPSLVQTVWIDGVRLATTPRIIERQLSYGVITDHILKIAVPIAMPAGPLSDGIGVIVTLN